MSCENAQNSAGRSAGSGGISRLSSKTAHYLGRAAGAGLGAALGTALGAIGGAPGMAVGAVVGGVTGYRAAGKRQAIRVARAVEARWQQSAAGQAANLAREKALAGLNGEFARKKARYKTALAAADRAWAQAREQWQAAQPPEQGLKGKLGSAGAETAARVLGQAAAAVATDYATAARWGLGFNAKRSAVVAGVTAAGRTARTSQAVAERRFRESPAGQTATAAYRSRATRLKLRYGREQAAYRGKRRIIEAQYQLARTKFLESHSGESGGARA